MSTTSYAPIEAVRQGDIFAMDDAPQVTYVALENALIDGNEVIVAAEPHEVRAAKGTLVLLTVPKGGRNIAGN